MFIFYLTKFIKIKKGVYIMDKNKTNFEVNEDIIDDTCDLDPNKICDNCCKCIEENKNYKIIKISKIITDENGG